MKTRAYQNPKRRKWYENKSIPKTAKYDLVCLQLLKNQQSKSPTRLKNKLDFFINTTLKVVNSHKSSPVIYYRKFMSI